jgi:hypothetical protein
MTFIIATFSLANWQQPDGRRPAGGWSALPSEDVKHNHFFQWAKPPAVDDTRQAIAANPGRRDGGWPASDAAAG